MVKRTCQAEDCEKEFNKRPSRVAAGGGKYCSLKCKHKSYMGENHPAWKGGPKPKEPNKPKAIRRLASIDKEHVLKNIDGTFGLLLALSKSSGYAYTTLYVWYHRPEQADVRELMARQKIKFVDVAEGKLMKKVNEESDWAIKYALTSLGKERGYGQQVDVQHSGIQKIEIEFKEPTAEKVIDVDAKEVKEIESDIEE